MDSFDDCQPSLSNLGKVEALTDHWQTSLLTEQSSESIMFPKKSALASCCQGNRDISSWIRRWEMKRNTLKDVLYVHLEPYILTTFWLSVYKRTLWPVKWFSKDWRANWIPSSSLQVEDLNKAFNWPISMTNQTRILNKSTTTRRRSIRKQNFEWYQRKRPEQLTI